MINEIFDKLNEKQEPRYKKGDRIQMISMQGDPDPIPKGTKGTVEDVQDLGQDDQWDIAVKWDTGRSLSVIWPNDKITLITGE